MAKAFVKSIKDEKLKIWYAKAAVGLIVSDGAFSEEERFYLQGILMFIGDPNCVQDLVAAMKNMKAPKLSNLRTDREEAVRVLLELATVIAADDKIVKKEASYLMFIGEKMGFDFVYTRRVLAWAIEYMKAERGRTELLDRAAASKAHFA